MPPSRKCAFKGFIIICVGKACTIPSSVQVLQPPNFFRLWRCGSFTFSWSLTLSPHLPESFHLPHEFLFGHSVFSHKVPNVELTPVFIYLNVKSLIYSSSRYFLNVQHVKTPLYGSRNMAIPPKRNTSSTGAYILVEKDRQQDRKYMKRIMYPVLRRTMQQFSGANIAHYYQLGGLKQQNFVLSWFWRPESNIKAPSEGSQGRILFASLQLLLVPGIPQLVAAQLQCLPPDSHGLPPPRPRQRLNFPSAFLFQEQLAMDLGPTLNHPG